MAYFLRLTLKTLGWAVISATLFVLGAVYKDCPLEAALAGAFVATLFKTPAYPFWEWMFERMWHKEPPKPQPCCLCCCKKED